MNTPQINNGYGIRITINWENPTIIDKEKIFYDTSSDIYFREKEDVELSILSVNPGGSLKSQGAKSQQVIVYAFA